MEEENSKEDSNFAVIFSAPTGYGKSSCTMALAEFIANESYLAERLVHVLPLRAIVSDLYRKAFRKFKDRRVSVGAQAMNLLDANKTPFFLPRLVYTTFDSFVHNLFRAPVAERDITRSHFDVPRYSIYTSLVVFDEAHLFSAEAPVAEREALSKSHSRMFTAFCAALESLSWSLTPLVIMTATMPSKLRESIILRLKTPWYATEKRTYFLEYNPELDDREVREERAELQGKTIFKVEVGDQQFLDEAKELNPMFKGALKQEDVCRKALEGLKGGARVLVVRNTVKDAVNTFKAIMNKGEDAVLIHGRLSARDRWTALNHVEQRLKTGGPFALVTTQVIEAGVDLDLDVLITDAAPLSSLIQRVGRIGRRLETRRAIGPAIYVVEGNGSGVYDERLTHATLELLRGLEEKGRKLMWRVPRVRGMEGCLGYTEALDIVYKEWHYEVDEGLREAFSEIDRYYMINQCHIKKFLDKLCSFVREEGMFQLAHWSDDTLLEGRGDLQPEPEGVWDMVSGSLIPVAVRTLAARWRDVLDIIDGQVKVLAVSRDEEPVVVPSRALYGALEEASLLYPCRFLRRLEETLREEFREKGLTAVAPVLRPGVYVRGEGLAID